MRHNHNPHPYIFSKCNVTLQLESQSAQLNVGSRAKREGERFKDIVKKLETLEKTLELKEGKIFDLNNQIGSQDILIQKLTNELNSLKVRLEEMETRSVQSVWI